MSRDRIFYCHKFLNFILLLLVVTNENISFDTF